MSEPTTVKPSRRKVACGYALQSLFYSGLEPLHQYWLGEYANDNTQTQFLEFAHWVNGVTGVFDLVFPNEFGVVLGVLLSDWMPDAIATAIGISSAVVIAFFVGALLYDLCGKYGWKKVVAIFVPLSVLAESGIFILFGIMCFRHVNSRTTARSAFSDHLAAMQRRQIRRLQLFPIN